MTASIIQTSTYSSNFLFYILKCRVIFVKRDESSKLYEKIYELKEKRLKINEQNINLANENLAYFKCKKKKVCEMKRYFWANIFEPFFIPLPDSIARLLRDGFPITSISNQTFLKYPLYTYIYCFLTLLHPLSIFLIMIVMLPPSLPL